MKKRKNDFRATVRQMRPTFEKAYRVGAACVNQYSPLDDRREFVHFLQDIGFTCEAYFSELPLVWAGVKTDHGALSEVYHQWCTWVLLRDKYSSPRWEAQMSLIREVLYAQAHLFRAFEPLGDFVAEWAHELNPDGDI